MARETVSLVMANYNHAHYLVDSLPRIFGQSRKFDQVIVVDDCSTDNSIEVLRDFQSRYPYLLVLQNEKNSGVSYSGNVGLAQAPGGLIAMSAADDRLEPHFVEQLASIMERHPHCGIATSYFTTFKSSSGEISDWQMEWSRQPAYLSQQQLVEMEIGGNIPGHASLYRKEMISKAGGVLDELKWHCDWFLNHVIAARTGLCFVPESLAHLRVNDTSYSSGMRNWELQREVITKMLQLVIKGEYLDVKEFFQGAKIFATLSPDISRLILEQPEWMTADFAAQTILMLRIPERQQLLEKITLKEKELGALRELCEATLPFR